MLIQFKKGRDSRPTLTCIRDDGSRTWNRVHPLPSDAILAEHLVGWLDRERAAEARWTAADLTEALQASLPAVARAITEGELLSIRAGRAEMFAAWHALPAGSTLVLEYSP